MKAFLSAVALMALATTAAHADTPAITLTSVGATIGASQATFGFEFSVKQNASLTALGVYNSSGTNTLAGTAQIGLWDTSGNLLISTTIPASTAETLIGSFVYSSVSPFTLVAGTDYIIGAYLSRGAAASFNTGQGGTATVDSNVTLIQDQYAYSSGLVDPSLSTTNVPSAWFGANFLTGTGVQVQAVPEPLSMTLLGVGVAGLGVLRRRRK